MSLFVWVGLILMYIFALLFEMKLKWTDFKVLLVAGWYVGGYAIHMPVHVVCDILFP